jgi:hypothetical protein
MARPKRRRIEDTDELGFVPGGFQKKVRGHHAHVGELYGPNVCQGLRRWARDRVLAQVGR